jgi:hypothetical protein
MVPSLYMAVVSQGGRGFISFSIIYFW